MSSRPPVVFPWIQIAGIHDLEEALLVCQQGVPYLGFPLGLAVHREDCSAGEAARIIARLPRNVRPVLITYLNQPEQILTLVRLLGVEIVQFHGEIEPPVLQELRSVLPRAFFIKSLVVGRWDERELLARIDQFARHVDAFITDSFDPATGAQGATGRVHDWQISRRLAAHSPRPVILAGGLTPENVAEAIRIVGPAGVDAHTGVEGVDGRKDPDRVRAFVRQAQRAFQNLRRME